MNLKQEINSWQFASCPIKEKGSWWSWTKEGLTILAEHIEELLAMSHKKEITFTSKNFDFTLVSNPYDEELYETK